MNLLTNHCFDELGIGQRASYVRQVTTDDIALFAAASGDVNPVHLDADYAATTEFGGIIAHGMLTGGFVSAALAMVMPGPGTVYLGQSLKFRLPVRVGDEITVELEVLDKVQRRQRVTIDCKAINQDGKVVASGEALVMAPTEKLSIARPAEPAFERR